MDKRINYRINIKTIFASASGLGISAIKTIRISGKETKKIFKLITKKKKLPIPRYSILTNLYDLKNSSIIDKAVVTWFQGPKSYSGEDMLEINIHGGDAVLEHLIENLLLIENVKEAKPGEFTRRAFQNNKMDFIEAEAVSDLINAETKTQKTLALQQLSGKISKIFNKWNSQLTKSLAYYEGQIDFAEDEVPESISKKVLSQVYDLSKEIESFLSEKRRGEIIRNGVEIVIFGKTNVGKSSLINKIVEKDIAIVSKLSGTTRDIIEKKINISNIPFIISDTAGLKIKPRNIVEMKGIQKTKKKINDSDLKLLVLDLEKNMETKILELVCNKTFIILNKCDLVSKKVLLSKIKYLNKKKLKNVNVVSALTGHGINSLLNKIEIYVKNKYKDVFLGEPVITRERHRLALKRCLNNLKKIDNNKNPELNAEDIRLALKELGNITGKYDIEKILGIVFKDFCIGK